MKQTDGLKKAIKAANGQAALARKLSQNTGKKIGQGHIWSWLNRSETVPAEYVIPIEHVTGIARHVIRPDIYPIESKRG
jgi:DNA-binding transcriptional regulator YdaS (Cro superfamily)